MEFNSPSVWRHPIWWEGVFSFHLYKLALCEQKAEAKFHWRSIKYYLDEAKYILPEEVTKHMQTLEELAESRHMEYFAPNLTEKIKKFGLLDEEEEE